MLYNRLVSLYESLDATTKKLEKAEILANFYSSIAVEELEKVVLLSQGIVFPKGTKELGIAAKLMLQAISKSYGITENEVMKQFKQKGDVGLVAEYFAEHKKQHSLSSKTLTVDKVYDNLQRLPDVVGSGSQDKKLSLLKELLVSASPKDAKYVSRTAIGTMRIGIAEGIVRDAIAKAFSKDVTDVEKSFNYIGDYGAVAVLAKQNRLAGSKIKIGAPLRVMLADRAKDIEEAHAAFKNIAYEIKYDGFRCVIHKDGDKVILFSRRLDDVTHQFPDVVQYVRSSVAAKQCILDSEVVAINKETGKSMPFQLLSRRIQRKYDIQIMVKEIPVDVNVFDILYLNGKNLMDQPLSERWSTLRGVMKDTKNMHLADHRVIKSLEEAKKFMKYSLSIGEEGLIAKNMDAHYQPGRRVGYWLKVKEIMDPLDLVIIGGTWSEGKRASFIGSILLGARKGSEFVPVGMLGSGLKEKESEDQSELTLENLTKILKKDIIEENGSEIKVKPRIVVEVGYEEIQKSPKYPSGFALRFPRLLRFRTEEKRPENADTVATVEKLYRMQRSRNK